MIIAAGGTGTRMQAEVPKQFLLLRGKPVLMHTMDAFYRYDSKMDIILVMAGEYLKEWRHLKKVFGFDIPHRLVEGGSTRFFSVKNGLEHVKEGSLVAIHDGVRPLVTETLIKQSFEAAEIHGSAVPVIPLTDSIRDISGRQNKGVDRNVFRCVQTPQTFSSSLIIKAYRLAEQDIFSDDASVVEASGIAIRLIDGEYENIKITRPYELTLAEAILKSRFPEER